MMKKYWNQILQGQDIRQNLSKIRQEFKVIENREVVLDVLAGEEERLILLLQSEDAKSRKNAALLMGDLGNQAFLAPIYCAYEKEEQQFLKSSYVAAMKNFDCRAYADRLKKRLELLAGLQVAPENQKHHMEETKELSTLLITMEGVKKHKFIGWEEPFDVVLLTNRNWQEVTKTELLKLEPKAMIKTFDAGLIASVDNLRWMSDIRTYGELLFSITPMEEHEQNVNAARGACAVQAVQMDPEAAAKSMINSGLMEFLSKAHEGNPPFYFRVEMRSKRPMDEKSRFVKTVASHLEKLSERKLINTTSNYEIELRLIENKGGDYNLLVKLYTLADERFAYRQEAMPTSIKPVNAALTVALAKEYMKEGAQVLDPFCGVGTMLIERHKAVAANTSYGIDKQEEAIAKAKENTKAAHQIIHYINRNFFTFQHDYLFDEIITNMPFQIGKTTCEDVYEIYKRFFTGVTKHLKDDALLVLYSHDRDYVVQMASKSNFKIWKEHEISKKEGTYVLILQSVDSSGSGS